MPDRNIPRLPSAASLRCGRRAFGRYLAIASVGAFLAISGRAKPLIVYNATASAPRGFYVLVAPSSLQLGALVLAWAPDPARELADVRGYLPATVPLVKRIAALAADRVCADGAVINIDGTAAASRRSADGLGRALPNWQGCQVLRSDEIFLMMQDVPDSFDSRYFGPVPATSVIGRLVPLWTW